VQARLLLSKLIETNSEPVETWLMLASVCRASGALPDALTALDQALTQSPRHFLALLMRASVLDRMARPEAATAYGIALHYCPDPDGLDGPTQKAVERARLIHGAHISRLANTLHSATQPHLNTMSNLEQWAIGRFIDDALHPGRRFHQEPVQFFYPGLPAIPFYDRAFHPWLETLEAGWQVIRDELLSVLDEDLSGFSPYIQYADSLPLDQWRSLNCNPDWSAFHLIDGGRTVESNARRCPRTLEILAGLPQPKITGRGPAAMFSALKPRTRIPPHTGISNTRLVVHLPLIVPDGCGFRVGNEVRQWTPGQAFVFDDTIEHEAWNDSDQVRVILIFDVWSPFLTTSQRAAITEIMEAMDRNLPPGADPAKPSSL
jgi:aspartate beta-hydroxylase